MSHPLILLTHPMVLRDKPLSADGTGDEGESVAVNLSGPNAAGIEIVTPTP